MRSKMLHSASCLLLVAPLLLAACASKPETSEASSAMTTANESKAQSDKALQVAQQALQTAQQAQQQAQAADQRAGMMYNRSLKKSP